MQLSQIVVLFVLSFTCKNVILKSIKSKYSIKKHPPPTNRSHLLHLFQFNWWFYFISKQKYKSHENPELLRLTLAQHLKCIFIFLQQNVKE